MTPLDDLFSTDESRAEAQLEKVVTLNPADFPDSSPLGGMYWQRQIEQAAFRAGGAITARLRSLSAIS